jgi:signal peptidase I
MEPPVADDPTLPATAPLTGAEALSRDGATNRDDGDGRGPRGGRLKTSKDQHPKSTRKVLLEWVVLIGGALVIAFVIKTFLFQAFYIPSESMTPTLQVGDRVLVNKLSYRLHDVNRGDIVVFESPDAPGAGDVKDLVKRVIGLPGETVEARDGQVYVDGRPLDEPYLPKGTTTDIRTIPQHCERPAGGQAAGCKVPADSIFVLGDNRGASKDGRVFGPIKESEIVGRVFVRIWPLGELGLL